MICPNCGKGVAQNAEICPFCNNPTQFSVKMKYYPRLTPLDANRTGKTQQKVPQSNQKSTEDTKYKEVLLRLSDVSKKKDLRSTNIKIFASAVLSCLIVALLLLCSVVFLAKRIGTNNATTKDALSLIDGKVTELSDSLEELQQTVDGGMEENKRQIESLESVFDTESVMITLYCNYPGEDSSSPICILLENGSKIKLPSLASSTHLFIGWKDMNSDKDVELDPEGNFVCDGNGTIQLVACWQAIATPEPSLSPEPTPTPGNSDSPFHFPGVPSNTPHGPTSTPTAEPSSSYGE